jgi:hypothetical protein
MHLRMTSMIASLAPVEAVFEGLIDGVWLGDGRRGDVAAGSTALPTSHTR